MNTSWNGHEWKCVPFASKHNMFLKVGFNCICDVILLRGHKLFYLCMFHFRLHMDLMSKCWNFYNYLILGLCNPIAAMHHPLKTPYDLDEDEPQLSYQGFTWITCLPLPPHTTYIVIYVHG